MRTFRTRGMLPRFVSVASCASLTIATCIAQSSQITVEKYPTRGNPTSALSTRDGRYLLVSVTNVGAPTFTGNDAAAGARADAVSGIEVFRNIHGTLRSVGFVRTGSTGANGLALLRGGQWLAVGTGDAGVAFLKVNDLVHGKGNPLFAPQTAGAGTFDVVATPDGRFVFSSNEYGIVDQQRGSVGIIATHIDRRGHVHEPQTIGQIAAGDVIPSLTLSPDGSRLYVASELVPAHAQYFIAGGNPLLTKSDCVQRKGAPPRSNGYITAIDVKRATALQPDAVRVRVASGCSPVRLVESEDASRLYVSARGDDTILAFNASLLEADPEHALIRAIPSGGTAPVGMRLFGGNRFLAVANSNRFSQSGGNLAILDVSGTAVVSQPTILPAGSFPRNIGQSRDGRVLFLTNYLSRTVEVVRVAGNGTMQKQRTAILLNENRGSEQYH